MATTNIGGDARVEAMEDPLPTIIPIEMINFSLEDSSRKTHSLENITTESPSSEISVTIHTTEKHAKTTEEVLPSVTLQNYISSLWK